MRRYWRDHNTRLWSDAVSEGTRRRVQSARCPTKHKTIFILEEDPLSRVKVRVSRFVTEGWCSSIVNYIQPPKQCPLPCFDDHQCSRHHYRRGRRWPRAWRFPLRSSIPFVCVPFFCQNEMEPSREKFPLALDWIISIMFLEKPWGSFFRWFLREGESILEVQRFRNKFPTWRNYCQVKFVLQSYHYYSLFFKGENNKKRELLRE